MNGWYIKSNGVKVILESTDDIDLHYMCLIELVIPDGVTHIWCYGNQLTKLDLPDSVQFISCWNNFLTELIVPDNCRFDCDYTVNVITKTMYNRSKRIKAILK
jgi:hypothetical protein